MDGGHGGGGLYVLQWKTSSNAFFDASRQRTLTGTAFNHTNLTTNPVTTYTYRVFAIKRGEPHGPVSAEASGTPVRKHDYDSDDDGLIEITELEQLRAIHYDMNGDGMPDDGLDETKFQAAFDDAVSYATSTALGCPSPGCTGYELRANLDFNVDGSYQNTANKTKWTTGTGTNREGWWVIGYMDDAPGSGNRGYHVNATAFTGEFDGNNDTDTTGDGGPYSISNLRIDVLGLTAERDATTGNSGNYHIGLFGKLGSAGTIRNLTLKNVDIDHDSTYQATSARVGAVVGESAGKIEYVTVSGSVRADADTGGQILGNSGSLALGGVVGELTSGGSVFAAGSSASVGSSGPYTPTNAGGLVGKANGTVKASYTTGSVGAATTAGGNVYAGGLVGELQSSGTVEATYALGAVSASSGSPVAGGLVGRMGGNIKYSYSIGVPSTTSGGGLVGSRGGGATTDSYWDTQISGITSTGQGTGKTTAQLQTPTGYTGIYANWNTNVDGVAGNDDPWDFGTSSDYPRLKFGSEDSQKAQSPPRVTWSASPANIWESQVGSADRVTTSTIAVSFSEAWTAGVTFTFPTPGSNAGYTLSATTITIAAGSTSGSILLTAVNNKTIATDKVVDFSPTASDVFFSAGVTGPTVTIRNDDDMTTPVLDALAKQANFTSLRASWPEVAGATSYVMQYSTTTVSTWTTFPNPKGGNTGSGYGNIISNLTPYRYYDVRVKAQKTGSDETEWSALVRQTPGQDYDTDDDGMIEVSTLAQLNAIRWDLDANGAVAPADETNYATAFPTPASGMGCPSDTCTGYELRANLDFDPNNNGRTDITRRPLLQQRRWAGTPSEGRAAACTRATSTATRTRTRRATGGRTR